MFGNRLLNTKSPGGVRRGLIWQSGSDGIPPYKNFWYNMGGGLTGNLKPGVGKILPTIQHREDLSNPYPWPYHDTMGTDEQGNPLLVIFATSHAERIDIDYVYDPDYVQQNARTVYSTILGRNIPLNYEGYGNGGYKDGSLEKQYADYPTTGQTMLTSGGAVMRIKGSFIYANHYFSCHKRSGETNQALPLKTITDYYDAILRAINYPSSSVFHGSAFASPCGQIYNMPMPEFMEAPSAQETRLYCNIGTGTIPDLTTNDPYTFYCDSRRILHNDRDRDPDAYFYEPFQFYFSPRMDRLPNNPNNFYDYMDYPRTDNTGDTEKRWYLSHIPEDPLFDIPFINFPYYGNEDVSYLKLLPNSVYLYMPTTEIKAYMTNTWGDWIQLPATDISVAQNVGGSTFPDTSASTGDLSAYGIAASPYVYSQNPQIWSNLIQIHNSRVPLTDPRTITGDGAYDRAWQRLQPSFSKGEKYLCNVSPSVAMYRTSTIDQNATLWSGRYKYLGFKGTVSFFEKYI